MDVKLYAFVVRVAYFTLRPYLTLVKISSVPTGPEAGAPERFRMYL
jgi:hypothetical protein